MSNIRSGRHNEDQKNGLAVCVFLLGAICCLIFLHSRDGLILQLKQFDWDQFWLAQSSWQSILPVLLIFLLVVFCKAVEPRGAWLMYALFFLQGAFFSGCTAMMCLLIPELGVYAALFSVAVPAVVLLLLQFLWMAPDLEARKRAVLSLIVLLCCCLVRQWGVEAAGEIYFR